MHTYLHWLVSLTQLTLTLSLSLSLNPCIRSSSLLYLSSDSSVKPPCWLFCTCNCVQVPSAFNIPALSTHQLTLQLIPPSASHWKWVKLCIPYFQKLLCDRPTSHFVQIFFLKRNVRMKGHWGLPLIPELLHWASETDEYQQKDYSYKSIKKKNNTCKSLTDTHSRRIEADWEEEEGDWKMQH